MKNRFAAAVTALVLAAAPLSSAVAGNFATHEGRWTGFNTFVPESTGSLGLGVHDTPFYEGCPMSSAAEGNANQQTRPVKQYGQTAGGYRC